jgi:hypothetical protein
VPLRPGGERAGWRGGSAAGRVAVIAARVGRGIWRGVFAPDVVRFAGVAIAWPCVRHAPSPSARRRRARSGALAELQRLCGAPDPAVAAAAAFSWGVHVRLLRPVHVDKGRVNNMPLIEALLRSARAPLGHAAAAVRAAFMASWRSLIDYFASLSRPLGEGARLTNLLNQLCNLLLAEEAPAVVDELLATFVHLCTRVAMRQQKLLDVVFGDFLTGALAKCTPQACQAVLSALDLRVGPAAAAAASAAPTPPTWHVHASAPLDSPAFQFSPEAVCRSGTTQMFGRVVAACVGRGDCGAGTALHGALLGFVRSLGDSLARACTMAAGDAAALSNAKDAVCLFAELLHSPPILAAAVAGFVPAAPRAIWEAPDGEPNRVADLPVAILEAVRTRAQQTNKHTHKHTHTRGAGVGAPLRRGRARRCCSAAGM